MTLCGQSSELELLSCVLATFTELFFSAAQKKEVQGCSTGEAEYYSTR